MKYLAGMAGACMLTAADEAYAQGATAYAEAPDKPTDDVYQDLKTKRWCILQGTAVIGTE